MRALRWLLFLLLGFPAIALGQPDIVKSDVISDVAVTIYRDPYRDAGMMNAGWPGGYALITETRTISVPQGDSVIRFENVAEGLLPETAIVSGLPSGVREKNRDARLISPAGLVDAYLKRRVLIRRTDPATGKVREETAIIQSGPDGGVLLRTAGGVEALRCSGLPERMIYEGVPDTLTAKPTLSILTRSARAVTATIQLTYMAQGFDWSANYIGTVAPDGQKMGLFAWLTVANGGQQTFRDARLQVIAGKVNKRPNNPSPPPPAIALNLQCWPMDTTSTHPVKEFARLPMPRGNDLSRYNNVGRNSAGSFETKAQRKARLKREQDEADYSSGGEADDIVVTGSGGGGGRLKLRRRSMEMAIPVAVMAMDTLPAPPPPPPVAAAEAVSIAEGAKAGVEDLGDLKLYRVPMRVTVAAQSQKQVAMINQPLATFARVYSVNVGYGGVAPQAAPFALRAKNTKAEGLGIPLPAGSVAVFEPNARRILLVGEYPLADLAIGEDVDIKVGTSPDVQWTLRRVTETGGKQVWRVDLTNARDVPVRAEVVIPYDLERRDPGLIRGPDGWRMPVEVLPNGTAFLTYRLRTDP
jgi:hypothetical protein